MNGAVTCALDLSLTTSLHLERVKCPQINSLEMSEITANSSSTCSLIFSTVHSYVIKGIKTYVGIELQCISIEFDYY